MFGIYAFMALVSHRSGRVEFRISNICFDFLLLAYFLLTRGKFQKDWTNLILDIL